MPVRSRTALVTGASGQDGVYLGRSLVDDGYRVVGVVAPGSRSRAERQVYLDGVEVVELDVRDTSALAALVDGCEPDEIYNLAALSSVGRSWEQPDLTHATNAAPAKALVDAMLALRSRTGREPRMFQASSAEVRGAASGSPYARSKAAAEDVVRRARDEHGLHAACGILSIHESPLRPVGFVSRKITRAAAAIALGHQDTIELGTLDVVRDWGFAGDYVQAMRRMLAVDEPRDLPIGTGVGHTLAELVRMALDAAGVDEPERRVVVNPDLVRPADAPRLVTDTEPARRNLGWTATTGLATMVAHMVAVDLDRLRTGVEESPAYLFATAS